MTASPPARPPAARLGLWLAGFVALGASGCGAGAPPAGEAPAASVSTTGTNDPSWLTSRREFPAPSPDRLDYDPEKRVLTFYELPGADRWMVQLPDEPRGHAVGPRHRLPEGVDTRHTLVYYARAGEKVSAPVTVAAIEACRPGPTSFAQR